MPVHDTAGHPPQAAWEDMSVATFFKSVAVTTGVLALGLAAAITLGGPGVPQPLHSISDPFAGVDFSRLPPLRHYRAEDGAELAYRAYLPPAGVDPRGSVVLVHGSSGRSNGMHVLAQALAQAGYMAYALDVRGHGASGPKGTIAYVGQLEDDLAAFAQAVPLAAPRTLLGFSSGGGFVLRFAGSARQTLFQRYVLLSPFLGARAPNYRPDAGGWVKVGVPRIIALTVLNHLGFRAFNGLTVIRFAVSEQARPHVTPGYDFNLATNFGPQQDVEGNIQAAHQPVQVLAGTRDEAFDTATLAGFFRQQGQSWPVTLLPKVSHVGITLDPVATRAVVAAVGTTPPP